MALEQMQVFQSDDPRLDWVSKHDSRSRAFRWVRRLTPNQIVPRRWKAGPTLDQGQEGACVGFGWTQEFLSAPKPYTKVAVKTANKFAHDYYQECLRNDEYPGEEDNGTSVLAGAQTAVRRGMIQSYRWAFNIDELRDAVITEGPAVIGIPWYDEMYATRPSGLVKVGGKLVGGHCILIDEYHPRKRIDGEDWHKRFEGFGWHNSWGNDGYGDMTGRGFIQSKDLAELIKNWGEMCIPMGRRNVPARFESQV